MKKVIPALTALIMMGLMSCSKDPVVTTSLTATKTSAIERGEPVVFTFSASTADSVSWRVNPSQNAQIIVSGINASVKFGSSGTYIVSAFSGSTSQASTVTVIDSIYTPPPAATTIPLQSGEQVNITASKLDSGAYSGIIFYAQTANSYTCLSNYLLSTYTTNNNTYAIGFTGVSVPGNCTTGQAKAGTFEYLLPLSDGMHPLTITLNGTTYTGSIIRSGSSYTINWSYTSGVTISPSTL
ncbi:MAG: hypothetical protein ABI691_18580 [Ginsengibacter sp.]